MTDMKIVVLDGYTLNPGDLSWRQLQALGDCQIYERSAPEEVLERAADAEVVLTNKTLLNRETLDGLASLAYIGVLATGYNVVDVEAARERNIPVTNIPTYGTRSVAQMTLALLLELTQHVGYHARTVREGRWSSSPDFCYWDRPLVELDGMSLGIIGWGDIGEAVGKLGAAFGMKVLVQSRTRPATLPEFARWTGLDELLELSDVVSLHCPLTKETRHMMNRERLASMKPGAFLLNTSRGALIDEDALAETLESGHLAGAGLDVLGVEPPPAGNPLFKAKNCLITPHIAWATRSARERLMETAVGNVRGFLEGKPTNVVNG